MKAIEIEGLTKIFGTTVALDNLHLSVEKGSIFGFLGPNGAGKTTTLRILNGLARPSTGTARILGEDISFNLKKTRYKVGYLPEVPSFYSWMTSKEYLYFVGEIFQIPSDELKKRTDYLLELAALSDIKLKISSYSRGMKQRLGIAQALVNQPEVLFLDEPTSALDPIGRKEVLEMIESLAGKTTVFFSTHILSDVERVCDTVAILNKGKLMTKSNLETLKAKYFQPLIEMEFDTEPTALEKLLKNLPWVIELEMNKRNLKVRVKDLRTGQIELTRLISQSSVLLRKFEVFEPSLEEIFVKMVEDEKQSDISKKRV